MMYLKFQSKLLFFGFFAVFFLTSNVFAQRSQIIEALDIQGNRRLTDVEIIRHIKTRPGERFDQKRAQEDLQSLLELGWFDMTNTRIITETGVRGGVNVIFEVRELPLIVELKFDGLRYIPKEELLAELHEQKLEIKAGTPYQPEKLGKARRVIIEHLQKRGLIDAKVEVAGMQVSATTINISFIIDEMPNDDEEEDDCCNK